MSNRKPITKVARDEVEISIVRLDDGREFRSTIKKMTRRQALTFQRSHDIKDGTTYTVEHVVVGRAAEMFEAPRRSIGLLTGGVFYTPGTVPYSYV